jgi:HlyD family secretion protein
VSPEKSSDESPARGTVRSREMQEIMGYIPRWIVRWGITVIAVSIVLILLGSHYFTYSETIASVPIGLYENPPATVDSKVDGKISQLVAADGQPVSHGDTIAVMENPADFRRVRQLKDMLNRFKPLIQDMDRSRIAGFKSGSLGPLKPDYKNLLKTLHAFRDFQQADKHVEKIRLLEKRIARHHKLGGDLSAFSAIIRREIGLIERYLKKNANEFGEEAVTIGKSVSPNLESQYFKSGLLEVMNNIDKKRMQIIELEKAILKTRIQHKKMQIAWETRVERAMDKLLSRIEQWEEKHLLQAPVTGAVRWIDSGLERKQVQTGEILAYVEPPERLRIMGRMKLPGSGSRRLTVGQTVNIRFPRFPSSDFGLVKGWIFSMTLHHGSNTFIVDVELPDGLITTQGKRIPFSAGLRGNAEVLSKIKQHLFCKFMLRAH